MSVVLSYRSTDKCVLQERDLRLMTDLFGHSVLTRDQIIRLGHFGSVQRCNSRLLRLRHHGYVQLVQHPAAGGASPSLYRLGRQAVTHLAVRLGIAEIELQRTISASAAVTFLEHTLQLTEVRLTFQQTIRDSKIDRFLWQGEALCRHVYTIAGQRRIIKPDSFMRLGNETWFVELDLGNASQGALQSKLESYTQYRNDGAYREVYGGQPFGLLFVTSGQQRLQNFLSRCANLPFAVLATERSLLFRHGPLGSIWSSQSSGTWPSKLLGGKS